ncbi:MAG: PepSY domain-containing protein [Planctomycetota bacterium]
MHSFKLFWKIHKWTGIIAAAIFAVTATTGFLLLIKKRVNWIQPPTMTDAAGEPADFISTTRLLEIVFAQNHPDFSSVADIDRIDFRPRQRVFKVRSRHHLAEIQVGAITGEVLSVSSRPSDLIEQIHDGSFFGDWVHDWVMPLVSGSLVVLIFSGYWVWLFPIMRRRRRRRRAEARRHAAERA